MPGFCDSERILNWMTSFHILHSCTILVYSISHTGFLLYLARFQHCNLGEFVWWTQVQTGSQGFFFHVVVFFRETFPTLAWKFLLCVLQKVFEVYIFPNFVLGVVHSCSKISWNKPKTRKYFLSYFICRWHLIVETRS